MKNDKISFKILANVGTLARNDSGWSKEINIVSWNNGPAKLDIRDWSDDHNKMSKGLTLTAIEAQRLVDSIQARDAIELLKDINDPSRSPRYER